jgi:hypothetical protein
MAVVAAETARLRQRHMEHILAMIYEGISMRLIRRHALDDPLLTDGARAVLVRAVMERRKKVRVRPRENLANRINIASVLNPRALRLALGDCQRPENSNEADSQPPQHVTDPQELQRTIETIRRRVSDYFQTTKLRDPGLKERSHRQIFAFPRQLAMYIARQLTGATLSEIGGQFGGRHHTTVLHAINKIQDLRRVDKDLDHAITRLMDALPR